MGSDNEPLTNFNVNNFEKLVEIFGHGGRFRAIVKDCDIFLAKEKFGAELGLHLKLEVFFCELSSQTCHRMSIYVMSMGKSYNPHYYQLMGLRWTTFITVDAPRC